MQYVVLIQCGVLFCGVRLKLSFSKFLHHRVLIQSCVVVCYVALKKVLWCVVLKYIEYLCVLACCEIVFHTTDPPPDHGSASNLQPTYFLLQTEKYLIFSFAGMQIWHSAKQLLKNVSFSNFCRRFLSFVSSSSGADYTALSQGGCYSGQSIHKLKIIQE